MSNFEHILNSWNELNNKKKIAAEKDGRNPDDILILAVSKTQPIEAIQIAMEAGIKDFGENYAQEIRDKIQSFNSLDLPQPKWHFIGHLQTNKVKYIAPFAELIHSVDSEKLALEISKQAEKAEKEIDILLQVNTSGEYSKSGCNPTELFELANSVAQIPRINILGLMTIGSFSSNQELVRKEFRLLRSLKDDLQAKMPNLNLKHLSMGMTNDFELAIAEGATIVRIGTAIFGERDYS